MLFSNVITHYIVVGRSMFMCESDCIYFSNIFHIASLEINIAYQYYTHKTNNLVSAFFNNNNGVLCITPNLSLTICYIDNSQSHTKWLILDLFGTHI